MRAAAARAGLFLGWAVAGALLALGVVAVLSIGPFALAAATVLIGLLAWRAGLGAATTGLLCGAGAIPVYVAYLNRGGPGEVCTTTGSGTAITSACVSESSPWPWLTAGLVLIATGAVVFAVTRRARPRA